MFVCPDFKSYMAILWKGVTAKVENQFNSICKWHSACNWQRLLSCVSVTCSYHNIAEKWC
jgi:hypothetical protein